MNKNIKYACFILAFLFFVLMLGVTFTKISVIKNVMLLIEDETHKYVSIDKKTSNYIMNHSKKAKLIVDKNDYDVVLTFSFQQNDVLMYSFYNLDMDSFNIGTYVAVLKLPSETILNYFIYYS
ncbi:MAG: hypothetical protein LBD05_02975 [Mycoplasmataceae bacterium]|jgi:hypothetical protein|nr:hypothetical protein [Mycoplasmataceae bacterium]